MMDGWMPENVTSIFHYIVSRVLWQGETNVNATNLKAKAKVSATIFKAKAKEKAFKAKAKKMVSRPMPSIPDECQKT